MNDSDFPARAGGGAIGARLRRLSARIDADATRAYAVLGIRFEQRWFGVLNQIAINGPMAVTDIASTLGITHVSVSQTRQSLEKAGLIASDRDSRDARRRTLRLTSKGQDFVRRLEPIWQACEDAARELDAEAGEVVRALSRLDEAIARKSLFDRIMARIGGI
ncbi:MarR family winged helix-turn-helix transcriptional regulator [Sphingopyxis witflariensis]|uniref:MarR family transcriptional regulator n=1 Tax=Sphingopyxis witflariensis TaxID=173675 RepID=A0A246JUJ2_9SPHN|nr:MarR family winged helix-turn-helix transcriptional regulator [Sphingopyxis witflariensis]OWQ96653.1 MarR family transcriptional regulator [Sphingopyxis witflariensis]